MLIVQTFSSSYSSEGYQYFSVNLDTLDILQQSGFIYANDPTQQAFLAWNSTNALTYYYDSGFAAFVGVNLTGLTNSNPVTSPMSTRNIYPATGLKVSDSSILICGTSSKYVSV